MSNHLLRPYGAVSGYRQWGNRRFRKAPWVRWNNYVAGRRDTLRQLALKGEATVSVYRNNKGKIAYSRPVTNPDSTPGPGVLYRIRIKMKRPA